MTSPPSDIPRQIARCAADFAGDANRLPPPVADLCRDLMLNAAAAALAGAAQPDAIALTRSVREMGGNGRSTIIGMGQRTSPVYAALVNGALIRLLDFDDHAVAAAGDSTVCHTNNCHPTAAVLPAVLALGEMHGSPGPAALCAFAVGSELVVRLFGDAALAGSAGAMGAAAASAMLLGLDVDATANAVALAAGSADAGIGYASAGANALASGRAAMQGVLAALQAAAGISANLADNARSGNARSDTAALDVLGRHWQLADPGVAIRLYPCHPAAHTIIDAALGLAQLHRFAPSDVANVQVSVTADTTAQLPYALPADGWQARACAGFIAAATLCHGPPLINFFSDVAVRDDGVRAMLERVSVVPSLPPSPSPLALSPHPAEVSVTLTDGRTLRHRADHARGSPQLPLDAEELEAKFLYCTRYILPADHIDEAIGSFRGIADIENVTGMVSVLGG